jgi:uncharacterized protein (TIGR02147 family)
MNVFEFMDYKKALNAILAEKRKTQKGLSRKLSEHLGVHATLISQILSGSKDFSEEQILSVCEYLGIAKIETKYLLALVQYERAGSKKLKDHFQEVIDQTRKQALQLSERIDKNRQLSDFEKSIFYSNWAYSAVHLLSTLEKPLDFEGICERLGLSAAKAREILDFLIQIQMVKEISGKFVSGNAVTHLEKSSPLLIKHHTNWRLKAIQASESLSDDELMYSANISLSHQDFAQLREQLVQTIKTFLEVVKPSPAEDIAQFNLDFFWIRK